jgi:diguanylate cyclase (GGDEF)-like protein/PAS domain S-box-containing protein
MLERPSLSLKPLYAAPALPAMIWLPHPELRFIASGILAWGAVQLWQEITRQRMRSKMIRDSMSLAGYCVVLTQEDGTISSVNAFFTVMTGFSEKSVKHKKTEALIAPRYGRVFLDEFWKTLKEKEYWEGELWCRREGGREFPAWIRTKALYDQKNNFSGYLIVGYDLEEKKTREQQLWYTGHHDQLTGLPNRQRIHDLLTFHIPRLFAARDKRLSMDLAVIDIDGFQMVNNSLGVEAGDRLLVAVAVRLRSSERIDLVGRLGGDEFLIGTQGQRESHDIWVSEVRQLFKAPFLIFGHSVRLSVSIGSCQAPTDGEKGDNGALLLQRMELALTRAKLSGSNTDRRFSRCLDAVDAESMQLVQALRSVIDAKEGMALHYQTQHDTQTGNVVGLEALLRWHHAERGMVAPGDFIPLAERYGMMEELGQWVIYEAVSQIKQWRDAGFDVPIVWINVSAIQVYQGSLEITLKQAITEHDIPPQMLGLEMTESLLLDDRAGSMSKRLRALREQGFAIAIDDFGTGHSSLSYLRDFPLNKVKLDRAFIQSLPDDKTNATIVQSVLNIANQLMLQVVAEGVETEQQLVFLQEQGCHIIQGFYFSRPLPADQCGIAIKSVTYE